MESTGFTLVGSGFLVDRLLANWHWRVGHVGALASGSGTEHGTLQLTAWMGNFHMAHSALVLCLLLLSFRGDLATKVRPPLKRDVPQSL